MKKLAYACIAGWCLLSTATLAQNMVSNSTTQHDGIQRLTVREKVPLQGRTGAILLPPQCDQEGNVYLRFYHAGPPRPPQEPVYKFKKTGEQEAIYSLGSDPEFQGKGMGIRDFAVGKDGDVHELAISKAGYYIISFGKNGKIKQKTKLAVAFEPFHFAVFDSGEFLITGEGRGHGTGAPFSIHTAIFDGSGVLRENIELPEDKPFVEAAQRGDSRFVEPNYGGNFAVERGQVTRGSDGNVYVVRWTEPARIYAIAASGDVVRSFEVKPDWEGRKPDGAYSSNGLLALEYAGTQEEPGHSMIKVVGLNSGEEQARYDTSREGGTLSCYTRGRFTFFAGDQLLFAQLR